MSDILTWAESDKCSDLQWPTESLRRPEGGCHHVYSSGHIRILSCHSQLFPVRQLHSSVSLISSLWYRRRRDWVSDAVFSALSFLFEAALSLIIVQRVMTNTSCSSCCITKTRAAQSLIHPWWTQPVTQMWQLSRDRDTLNTEAAPSTGHWVLGHESCSSPLPPTCQCHTINKSARPAISVRKANANYPLYLHSDWL